VSLLFLFLGVLPIIYLVTSFFFVSFFCAGFSAPKLLGCWIASLTPLGIQIYGFSPKSRSILYDADSKSIFSQNSFALINGFVFIGTLKLLAKSTNIFA